MKKLLLGMLALGFLACEKESDSDINKLIKEKESDQTFDCHVCDTTIIQTDSIHFNNELYYNIWGGDPNQLARNAEVYIYSGSELILHTKTDENGVLNGSIEFPRPYGHFIISIQRWGMEYIIWEDYHYHTKKWIGTKIQ